MAQLMQAYWVAFAVGGVPSTPGKPQWPRFTKPRELQMIFDERGARVAAAGGLVLDSIAAAVSAAAAATSR
jgi:carboxylesterase type B